MSKPATIDIVFDGPPGPVAGRFVEVERDGKSIRLGEWVHRPDGFWALRIPDPEHERAARGEQHVSSYFDDAWYEVHDAAHVGFSGWNQAACAAVEERVIRDVLALTGDREFPADLRERALERIATLRCGPPPGLEDAWPPTEGAARTLALRRSVLIDALHGLWREIARRRIAVRWGVLTDDPVADVRARDQHDAEHA